MPHQMDSIVALANAGAVEAAESLMAFANRNNGLSGHDQQTCENAIAKAKARAAESVQVAAAKRTRKPAKRRRRTTK